MGNYSIVVLDFETTGLSPNFGDRVIEIGAVLVQNNKIGRLYPDAPNHKLETLVRYKKLKICGTYHRALADAEIAGNLWIRMIHDIDPPTGRFRRGRCFL